MDARVKISAPSVPAGRVVEVVAVDNGVERVLSRLGNGEGWVLPVVEGEREILLRVRGA